MTVPSLRCGLGSIARAAPLALAALAPVAACGGHLAPASSEAPDGAAPDASSVSPDSGPTGGRDATLGDARSGACVIPAQHRATATACAPHGDGGVECSNPAICEGDAGDPFHPVYCLHGTCTPDRCLSDADCASDEVCDCGEPLAGYPTGWGLNACVPATCHVDADCGACGYCSPSPEAGCGPARGVGAYGCHAPGDACTTDADCGSPTPSNSNTSPYCAFTPETGQWSCTEGTCGG